MNAGPLRHRLVFQVKTVTGRDVMGAEVATYPTAFRAWGECQRLNSREFPAFERRHSQTTARFIIRYRTGIDPALHQISHAGKLWDITDPVPDERGTQLIIEASETT